MWHPFYQPPDLAPWKGRSDAPRFHHLVKPFDFTEDKEFVGKNVVVLLGFCSDEGVRRNQGNVGAAEGPYACRRALAPLPFHGPPSFTFYDGGNVVCRGNNLEGAQEALGHLLSLVYQQGATPVVIGGGHEVAWAQHLGLEGAYPGENYSIVNLDAHFDLRPLEGEQGSSGTPFLQIAQEKESFDYCCLGVQPLANTPALFAEAKRLGVVYFSAEDIYSKGIEESVD